MTNNNEALKAWCRITKALLHNEQPCSKDLDIVNHALQSHDGAEVGREQLRYLVDVVYSYATEGKGGFLGTPERDRLIGKVFKTPPEPASCKVLVDNSNEPAQGDVLGALERWDQKSGTFKSKPAKGDG